MAEVDDVRLSDAELERAAAPGTVEASSRDGRQGAAQAYTTYHRWLRLKRLALAAFITLAALFI